MYSQHAIQRMQQRGIQRQDVELLLQYGSSNFHRGMEVVSFDRQTWFTLLGSEHLTPSECDRLRNTYVVVVGNDVITVAHKTRHFRRDRH